ncbi:MAG: CPBP family glutamic-type intramembrane protease [Verrucomicrobiae bacterium]|nr:CPBP family glutamic-type intramembrane protease [Verrucomicrobiae bacterium]
MLRRPPASDLLNTAGEPESDAFSRRWNLIEAFVVMTLLLVALWWIAYPFSVVGRANWANTAGRAVGWILAVFVLFIGPWLHRDTPASRGLGNPRRLFAAISQRPALLGGLFCAGFVILTILAYWNAPHILRFLFRIPRAATIQFQQTPLGKLVIFCGSAGFAWLWLTYVVRYDNFWPALHTGLRIVAWFLPPALLLALLVDGNAIWARFNLPQLAVSAFGYVFWGAFQQLVFCSYFGTRLRKGFGPASDPRKQRPRRLTVAALSGLFFGLIHVNSWWLVALTWLLGTILSWVFMEDRNRNILALGVVHGVLGTCRGWLFGRGSNFYISPHVGPWNAPATMDLMTLTYTSVVIVGFCAVILSVFYKNENPP